MEEIVIKTDMPSHPKVLAVGPVGAWLQVCAICYAGKHNTQGFVPRAAVPLMTPIASDVLEETIGAMLAAGLWVEVPGGYVVHEFSVHQDDFLEKQRISAIRREAGRKGGQRSGAVRSGKTAGSKNEANREANVKQKSPASARNSGLSGEAKRSKAEANDEANMQSASKQKTGPDSRDAHANTRAYPDKISVNHQRDSRVVNQSSTTSSAHEHPRGAPPRRPSSPSPIEQSLEPTHLVRANEKYLKLNPNLDPIWLSGVLWRAQELHPDVTREDLTSAIGKAITSTKPETAKSSVTAYAAAILMDRIGNEIALSKRRKSSDASHRGGAGQGDGLGGPRPGNGRHGPLGPRDRERLLRASLAGDAAGVEGDDDGSDAGDSLRLAVTRRSTTGPVQNPV